MCSSPELHLAIHLFTYLLEEGCTDAMAQACRDRKTMCSWVLFLMCGSWALVVRIGSKCLFCWAFLPAPPLHPCFLSQGLSVNLELAISTGLANQQALGILPVSIPLSPVLGYRGIPLYLAFTWVLEIRTQLPTLEQPALYPLSHLLSPRSIMQRWDIAMWNNISYKGTSYI